VAVTEHDRGDAPRRMLSHFTKNSESRFAPQAAPGHCFWAIDVLPTRYGWWPSGSLPAMYVVLPFEQVMPHPAKPRWV
jgi:hypothetical protein